MSLLKRIEKGQPQTPQTPAPGQPGGSAARSGPPAPPESSKLAEMRMRRPTIAASPARDAYLELKTRVQTKLLAELDPSMDVTKTDEVRASIEELFDAVLTEENIILSRVERSRLFDSGAGEIRGFGRREPGSAEGRMAESMVNGPKNI